VRDRFSGPELSSALVEVMRGSAGHVMRPCDVLAAVGMLKRLAEVGDESSTCA
jgi:hypothetical protein